MSCAKWLGRFNTNFFKKVKLLNDFHWVSHSQQKPYTKKKKIKSLKNMKLCKDMDENKCRVCGDVENVSAHHIVNRSLGGDDSLHNLISLCFRCHRAIHDGKIDFRDFLNKLSSAHPKLSWFRWDEALAVLNSRGK